MSAPWDCEAPVAVAEIETDDDGFRTVDKWRKEVFRSHFHEEFNWIVPMRPGRVVMRVEDREVSFDGNQWLCIFPRTPHAVVHVSDDCEVIGMFISSEIMERAYRRMRPPPPLGERFVLGGKGQIAQGLALEWGEQRFERRPRDPFDDAFADFLGGWLWRAYERRVEETESLALRLRVQLGGGHGETAASFLEEHLAETPFPWEALAERVGTSQRTLQRHFLVALGLAPTEVLARLRIERAKDLLRDPAHRIADVGILCGYGSQAHFSTTFKASTGLSPGRYRRETAGEGDPLEDRGRTDASK
jgi:AraC-like DNA-binding protein